MISLLEKLLSLDDSSPKGVALNQGKYLPDSPINQLRNMVAKLEKLYILKHNHSILVSYDTFANQYGVKVSNLCKIWCNLLAAVIKCLTKI